MWEKVEKFVGRGSGAPVRTSFAVERGRTGEQSAYLIVPRDKAIGARANIYSDGNGKLAFHISDAGEYAVFTPNKTAKTKKISIPRVYANRIPFGTTDVNLSRDGDMWVLDLNAF